METLFVLLAQLVVLLPMWSLSGVIRANSPGRFTLLVLASASMALPGLVAALLLVKAHQPIRLDHTVKATARIRFVWGSVVVFLIAAGFWSWACIDPASGEYLSQRTVFPFSGLSPALPLLLVVAGIYHWGWMNCRRIVCFETRRPDLPRLNSQNRSGIEFDDISEEFKKMLGRQIVPHSGLVLAVFLCMLLTAAIAGLVPRSLDGLRLDVPLSLLMFILWLMVIFAWFRFIKTWWCFRKLLRAQSPYALPSPFAPPIFQTGDQANVSGNQPSLRRVNQTSSSTWDHSNVARLLMSLDSQSNRRANGVRRCPL